MKVPLGIIQLLKKKNYVQSEQFDWKYSKGMAYKYFWKRNRGYLVTVCLTITGYYYVEVLRQAEEFKFPKKGFK